MEDIHKKFEAIAEDTLRKFPSEELTAMYERYLNGEKDLYKPLHNKLQSHVLDVLRTPPPVSFKFTPPDAPVKPKQSLKFTPPSGIYDMISARKKLDFEIENCIKNTDVYKFSLQMNEGDESKAYTHALSFYSGK
jgi:hypothetical protein